MVNLSVKIQVLVLFYLLSNAYADGGKSVGQVQNLQKGEQVFKANCVMCHGPKGHGDGPAAAAINPKPRNLAKDKFKFGSSVKQIFETISKGIPGTAMPSWNTLPESDRHAVAEYIYSLRK